jgi:hypothetical protein
VVAVAQAQHLSLVKTYAMPANNLSVIFQAWVLWWNFVTL